MFPDDGKSRKRNGTGRKTHEYISCGRKNVRPYNSAPIVSNGTCSRRFAARLRHVINGVFRMKKFLLFAILSLAASGCMSKTVTARKEKKPPFPSATPEAVTAGSPAGFPPLAP